ncbi:hypothetical protein J4558_16985 [Leptolyngbya sp. 15MV]|nr:hypothetical protein J4558_16985 [Leptolyngbya sp. 15MV]
MNRFTPNVAALLSAFPVASLSLDREGRPYRVVLGGSVPPCLMEAARNGPVTLDWVQLDEHGNTIAYRLAQP